MGLFTKKDADGLPAKFKDLLKDAGWGNRKYQEDMDYKRRILEKLRLKGEEQRAAGKLTGWSEYGGDDAGLYLDCLTDLQSCYAMGYGGPVDEKAAFEVLLLRQEIMTEFLKKRALSKSNIENFPYLWENIAYHYMTGNGCEKDSKQYAKYLMMAFDAWNQNTDRYGISGARVIREQMAGYPYPTFPPAHYARMAAAVRSRGGEHACMLMQEIESYAQTQYHRLGASQETDVEFLMDEAAKGNAWACYRLGICYLNGIFVEQNEEKGIAWLEKAAETLYVAADKLEKHCWDTHNHDRMHFWQNRMTQLESAAKAKYPPDRIEAFINEAQEAEEAAAAPVEEKPGSVLDMPELITDDLGRTWIFASLYGDADTAIYKLSNLEELQPGDLGDALDDTVYIKNKQISGNTAKTPLRTFHW